MRNQLSFGIGFVLLGLVIAACSSKSSDAPEGAACTAGNYVFCRCEDRTEGTKLCRADGASFDDCKCAGADPGATTSPPADAGFTPVPESDAGAPPPTGPSMSSACAGKIAVIAGSGDASNEYLYASYFDGTSFKTFSSTGVPMRGPATIVTAGSGLIGVYRSRNDWLVSTSFASSAWAAPVQIGSATTTATPTLTAWGTALKAVFLGSDGRYYGANHDPSTGWDMGTELLGATTAPVSGTSPPSAASAGTPGFPGSAIVVGFTDDSGALYRQEWHGTGWLPTPIKSSAAQASADAPSLVAMTGGAFDLVSVWIGQDALIHAATRTTHDNGNVWSNPILVDADAQPMDGTRLAPLADGKALLVYRDATQRAFVSIFDPAGTPQWSKPAALVAGTNPALASLPSVSQGTCGDDVSIAYAEDGGNVSVVQMVKGKWVGPFVVSGLSKLTYAAIGEMP
jgi:hypothetical protein